MQAAVTVTPAQLPELLLNIAVARPVFLWGAPGIGKSSLVRDFAASLGLERAKDFPATGPVLLITDGFCDHVRVRREHAWLLPAGRSLPFPPRGPVFRVR